MNCDGTNEGPVCDLCGAAEAPIRISTTMPEGEEDGTNYCLACVNGRKLIWNFVVEFIHQNNPADKNIMVEMERLVGNIVSKTREVVAAYKNDK